MLADHNRMAAYHSAILGNAHVFEGKVVMDIGTGSGILAVWAAQAGARKVYASTYYICVCVCIYDDDDEDDVVCVCVCVDGSIPFSKQCVVCTIPTVEYTDMAKHAQRVMDANGVSDIVTVIQGAVEDVELPMEQDGLVAETSTMNDGHGTSSSSSSSSSTQVVDIIISEWMGYFLLRESMLDSIIRARDKFLKPTTGLMFPSHTTMYLAPVTHEEERKNAHNEYNNAMSDWYDFAETTMNLYGVNMTVLERDFDREQKEYYLWSSRWTDLPSEAVLAEPHVIKQLDMITCTLQDARGIDAGDPIAEFDFLVDADEVCGSSSSPISALCGWFTADFKSRTDVNRTLAPELPCPAFLSTGPESDHTHWGQQTFYLPSSIPLIRGERTRIKGSLEMQRTKENSRLYNCRIKYATARSKIDLSNGKEHILMQSNVIEQVYQIP